MSKRDLDKYFARNGPCHLHPTRYARHRLIDNIRGRHRAGDSIDFIAKDCGLSREAVKAAVYSTPGDNKMTPKEIREGKAKWEAK